MFYAPSDVYVENITVFATPVVEHWLERTTNCVRKMPERDWTTTWLNVLTRMIII